MKQGNLFWPLVVGLVLVLVMGFLALTNAIGIWRIPELWSQIFAACTGAIVVAVVTMVLMHGQRATEEAKEKSIKIYESKVAVYSRFVTKMYKLLEDDQVSCDDFLALRTEIFSSLIFYLDDSHLRMVFAEIGNIKDFRDGTAMVSTFARITNILQDDLLSRSYRADDREQVLVDLWQRFETLSAFCPIPGKKED
ncbi:MAG: hypothetical protein IJV22_04725 [Bacteroidales bacterium]|nr:hypothetical protein [Bacteroidales bacterium]